jgi:large repetitive protein
MKSFFCFWLLLGATLIASAQENILNPKDSVLVYDAVHPPVTPPMGESAKWVVTHSLPWLNSSSFKPYYYNGIAMRLKYPKTYQQDVEDGKKYPMIIFLHGIMERGEIYDNEMQLKWGAMYLRDMADNGLFDGYLLFPQSKSGGWNSNYGNSLEDIIKYMASTSKLDIDRVIIMGISSGSHGAWQLSAHKSRYIAGCVAISGFSDADAKEMPQYREIPVWMAIGAYDPFYSKTKADTFVQKFRDMGGNISYDMQGDLSHICWDQSMMKPEFAKFIQEVNKANPTLVKGKTNYAPGENIEGILALTPGFMKYEWRKDGVVLKNEGENELKITAPGKYEARFRRGNSWSSWSPAPVVIAQQANTVAATGTEKK